MTSFVYDVIKTPALEQTKGEEIESKVRIKKCNKMTLKKKEGRRKVIITKVEY